MGARLKKGAKAWSEAFVLADTPDLPDTNPCMTVDPKGRLWLFYGTIQNNQWESALLKLKVANKPQGVGTPKWDSSEVVHLKPSPEFGATLKSEVDKQLPQYLALLPQDQRERLIALKDRMLQRSEDKLSARLGWMTRAHPIWLKTESTDRLVVGLYSDGFNCGLMAITDDLGQTWKVSPPVVGGGNVQPTLAQRKDGTLVSYFRDNGPPPKRVSQSESQDAGQTWSQVVDSDVTDTGAGVDVLVLKSGKWLLINNDLVGGRYRLSIHMSEDEGRTWPKVTRLEDDSALQKRGSYSYPSIIQAKDGTIHATYSYTPSESAAMKEGKGECIKHVSFNEEWLLANAKPENPPAAK
jgi:hypothetical protein